MYSQSNAAYLKRSIERRKRLFPLNITYCLPPFPTAPTNSFIAKSMLESAPPPHYFGSIFLFYFLLLFLLVTGCRSLQCLTVGHCDDVLPSVAVHNF